MRFKFLSLAFALAAVMLITACFSAPDVTTADPTADITSTSITSDPGQAGSVTPGSQSLRTPGPTDIPSETPAVTEETTEPVTDDPGTPTPEPSPTVEPTPTPIPTATPTPVPAKGSVSYNTNPPDAGVAAGTQDVYYYNYKLQDTSLMSFDLQYSRYSIYSDYVVFLKAGALIYSDVDGWNIAKSVKNSRYPLVLKTTDGNGTVWLGFYMGGDYPPATPTPKPTATPTAKPTAAPTEEPTEAPTDAPAEQPTEQPTDQPTEAPGEQPTDQPEAQPTESAATLPPSEPSSSKAKYNSPYGVDMSKVAFVKASDVSQRSVNYYSMYHQAEDLRKAIAGHKMVRVSNYRNANGRAPAHNGTNYDAFGMYYHQCAPAYYSPSRSADFRYFMDGELLIHLYDDPTTGFTAVSHPRYGGTYFVPSYYLLSTTDACSKVMVVDITNQNQAALEYRGGKWVVLGVTYCTSGATGGAALPTEPGWFRVLDKLSTMYYYYDGTTTIEGYAKYAIRFNGGAFIHGVPTSISYGTAWEYDYTLGTIPLSHKCVRSPTSYTQFLFGWASTGDSCVIVTK